jgi:hypothetical protein
MAWAEGIIAATPLVEISGLRVDQRDDSGAPEAQAD